MKKKLLLVMKGRPFIAISFLLLGALVVLGIRFATYKVEAIHYHANFALYINGQREEFKSPLNYSEIEMCTVNKTMTPSDRAHMHDNINNVVHVEDHAVTWGQFFTNLGWIMGPTAIISPDGTVYAENGDSKLHLMLNGQDYTDLSGMQNVVIKDQDRLLVSFGSMDDVTIKQQFNDIPSTAAKYDTTKDPASCSGNHTTTIRERLTHIF